MKCPLHRKFCQPKSFKEYECGSWFCAGVKVNMRKSRGGVRMDVVRLCGKGYFLKGELLVECTPDEAATLGGMLSNAAAEWLNDSDEYQDFIAEDDKWWNALTRIEKRTTKSATR